MWRVSRREIQGKAGLDISNYLLIRISIELTRITNGFRDDFRSIVVSFFRLLSIGCFGLSQALSCFKGNPRGLDKLTGLELDIVAQHIKEKKMLSSHGL